MKKEPSLSVASAVEGALPVKYVLPVCCFCWRMGLRTRISKVGWTAHRRSLPNGRSGLQNSGSLGCTPCIEDESLNLLHQRWKLGFFPGLDENLLTVRPTGVRGNWQNILAFIT